MDFITNLFNIIKEYSSYLLGFFTSFIEAATSQLNAGNVIAAVLVILIIWIKFKKMS